MKINVFLPQRMVFMTEAMPAPQTEKPVSIEEELKKETIGERQVALVLNSREPAGKNNPDIKKYLADVQTKLNRILARKGPMGVRSIPQVEDIEPGNLPRDIEGMVVRGNEMSRAYRKVYAELMTLAVDSLAARQENEFNSHKMTVCNNRANSLMAKFNENSENNKQLTDKEMEKVAEFINSAMGVNFDGKNTEHLNQAERVKLFDDALKDVNIDGFAPIILENRENIVYFTDNGVSTPNRTRMSEFANLKPEFAACLHGLMFRATVDARKENSEDATILARPYNCYLLDTMVKNNVTADTSADEFRKLFMTFQEFKKDTYTVARYEKAYNNDLETARMTPEQKVELTAKFFNDAVKKAQEFIQKNQGKLSENQYLTVFNNLLANEWAKEEWNSRSLDAQTLSKGAQNADLTILTFVSEGKPPQVPVPEGPPANYSSVAKSLLARLNPSPNQQQAVETTPRVAETREQTPTEIAQAKVKDMIRRAIRSVRVRGLPQTTEQVVNRLNLALSIDPNGPTPEEKKLLAESANIRGISRNLLKGHTFEITYDTKEKSFSAKERMST